MDALAYADELARRDESLAAAIAALAEAQRRVDAIRAGAEEIAAFRTELPHRRAEAERAVAAASADLEQRRAELAPRLLVRL